MNKALMISIRPEHAYNIIVGKKTLELRTWIPKDYVGWVYVYVTKKLPLFSKIHSDIRTNRYEAWNRETFRIMNDGGSFEFVQYIELNGLVAFRFWFDNYDLMEYVDGNYEVNPHDIPLNLCLDIKQINDYGNGKTLYAWHIKQLEIFDTPKELSEFESRTPYKNKDRRIVAWGHRPIIRAPQKMQWVYVKELEK